MTSINLTIDTWIKKYVTMLNESEWCKWNKPLHGYRSKNHEMVVKTNYVMELETTEW